MLPVALLAGGLATRLGDLSARTPKALLPVGGEPFINHQLRLLRRNGVERVVICAGYLGEMISSHVGDGNAFGLSVCYSFDWPDLLGTGGALKRALPQLGDAFMVLYGDSYLPVDYRAVARAFAVSGKPALMTVYRNDGHYDTSNVLYRDETPLLYDKQNPSPEMRHIDYGLGCLSGAVLKEWPADKFDLADVYSALSKRGALAGYEVPERFYEIGSRTGLAELDALLAGKYDGEEQRMSFATDFMNEVAQIVKNLDTAAIEKMAAGLAQVRARGGRLFLLGVGGSAASASHAVNDFRKLCGFEAYCPTDNVSELTARTNDEGWDSVFAEWLKGSRLRADDALLIFSVGGGDLARNVSPNLVKAVELASATGTAIYGIVGRDGGFTAQKADVYVIVPTINPSHVTPHTEAFHGVVWHLLVSHPALKTAATKWESTAK